MSVPRVKGRVRGKNKSFVYYAEEEIDLTRGNTDVRILTRFTFLSVYTFDEYQYWRKEKKTGKSTPCILSGKVSCQTDCSQGEI